MILASGRGDEDIGVLGGGGDGGDPAGVSHKGAAERELLSHIVRDFSQRWEGGEEREKRRQKRKKKGKPPTQKGNNFSQKGNKSPFTNGKKKKNGGRQGEILEINYTQFQAEFADHREPTIGTA